MTDTVTTPTTATEPQQTALTRVLADHLDHIADQIRAVSTRLPGPVGVTVHLFAHGTKEQALATVDVLAEITGQPAQWDTDTNGAYGSYRTELRHGQAWSLTCHAYEKRPTSTEDQLRARVAELESQLAAGGAK